MILFGFVWLCVVCCGVGVCGVVSCFDFRFIVFAVLSFVDYVVLLCL